MILATSLILDALFGEPRWLWSRLPHPAVLMGRAIALADRYGNRGRHRRARGTALLGLLVIGVGAIGLIISGLPGAAALETIVAAVLLAQRSLSDHVAAVARELRQGIPQGRAAVAMIVGRDTRDLDGPGISRAAIESAAENLSDGVVAPAFWFLVAGLPGLLVYKITNTADSMIGYRTDRYARFGWAAARLDDVLNWIPARLTALGIWLSHGGRGQWADMRRDAAKHRSPNAGWPEAAMAAALDVALSGPRSYEGTHQHFPYVHPAGNRDPGADSIDAAVRALWRTWALGLAIVIAFAVV